MLFYLPEKTRGDAGKGPDSTALVRLTS